MDTVDTDGAPARDSRALSEPASGGVLSPTPTWLAAQVILVKDLRTELRTLRSLAAMALFAVTTFIIFRFGLDRTQLSGSLASGTLWVTLLFAAILGINRLFVAEREEGGFDAIRLAPIDRTALLIAKIGALFVYLCAIELVTVPVFALFFLTNFEGLLPLGLILVLANIGLASTGVVVSSMAVNSRARDLLTPLVLLPLIIPLMVAVTALTGALLEANGPDYERFWSWLTLVGLYDLIFLLVGYAIFDFLLED